MNLGPHEHLALVQPTCLFDIRSTTSVDDRFLAAALSSVADDFGPSHDTLHGAAGLGGCPYNPRRLSGGM